MLGGQGISFGYQSNPQEPVVRKKYDVPAFQTGPALQGDNDFIGLSGNFTPTLQSVVSLEDLDAQINLLQEQYSNFTRESGDPKELLTLAYTNIQKIKRGQVKENSKAVIDEALEVIEKATTILNDPTSIHQPTRKSFSPLVVEQIIRNINQDNLFPEVFRMSLELLSPLEFRTIINFLKKKTVSIVLNYKAESREHMEDLFDYLKNSRNSVVGSKMPNISDALTLKYLQDIKLR